MIDWHNHILPGIDDGSGDLTESLAMARILAEAGFSEIYCTPHCINGLYDNTPQIVRTAVAALQDAIDAEGLALRLHPGMEYFLDEFLPQRLEDPLPLGETGLLLVEAAPQADPERVKDQLFTIRRCGLTPLIAHPERYEFLAAPTAGNEKRGLLGKLKSRMTAGRNPAGGAPDLVRELRDMGCLLQANLGSFSGMYGSNVQRKAAQLLATGSYFCYGSDAHREGALEKILKRGLDQVAGVDFESAGASAQPVAD